MTKNSFSSRLKIAFLNIMQAFGSAANQWATNAKLRVQEINLESRRHEILTKASLQAFELWHNGVKLPKELSDMFTEISVIDDKLSIVRAQKYAKVKEEQDELPVHTASDDKHPLPDEIDAEALVTQAVIEPDASGVKAAKKRTTSARKSSSAKKPPSSKPKE